MISKTRIQVDKLTPRIGAEVSGVDLSQPLPDDAVKQVQDALLEHLVLFFRDQALDERQLIACGRRFGGLHVHPKPSLRLDGFPEIMVIKADETSKHVAGEDWHSDVSYESNPPWGVMLHMIEVPPSGGDTLWASMYAAYDALSEPLKEFLAGLTAVHDREQLDRHKGQPGYYGKADAELRAEHPIIRAHPLTGRKLLYVNREFTTHIPQLSRAESASVLEMLYRHIETPEFHCRFRWRKNSVAFWDNRATQHHAVWDYYPSRRFGRRVTIM